MMKDQEDLRLSERSEKVLALGDEMPEGVEAQVPGGQSNGEWSELDEDRLPVGVDAEPPSEVEVVLEQPFRHRRCSW